MFKRNFRKTATLVILLIIGFLCIWVVHSYTTIRNRPAQTSEQWTEASKRDFLAFERLSVLCAYASSYADEHNGYLPVYSSWEDALRPYAAKDGQDISVLAISPFLLGPRRFAMNKTLSAVIYDCVKIRQVVITQILLSFLIHYRRNVMLTAI